MSSSTGPHPEPLALDWQAGLLHQQLSALLPEVSVELVARLASTNSALLARARAPGAAPLDPAAAPTAAAAGAVPVTRWRSRESRAFDVPPGLRRAADRSACLLVAEQQTGGRGRLGRTWQSACGASLTFSLALPLAPPDWAGLSLAVGVALADALEPPAYSAAAAAATPCVRLKWPNDLWLCEPSALGAATAGRKLGGILIETVSAGDQRIAVVGVGLNILPFGVGDVSSGTAFLQEIDPDATAPRALGRVALPLVQALLQFEREGFAAFATRYAARDALRGQLVHTTQPDAASGIADGVSATGALRLRTEGGALREIVGGEVSVRLGPLEADA